MKTLPRIVRSATVIVFAIVLSSCKKSNSGGQGGGGNPNPVDTTTVNPQVDPALANTIGFFMDDWGPRNFTIPSSTTGGSVPVSATYTVTVDRSDVITKI